MILAALQRSQHIGVSLQIAEELASRLKLELIPKADRQHRSQQTLQREKRVALEQKLQDLYGDELGVTIYRPPVAAKVRTVIRSRPLRVVVLTAMHSRNRLAKPCALLPCSGRTLRQRLRQHRRSRNGPVHRAPWKPAAGRLPWRRSRQRCGPCCAPLHPRCGPAAAIIMLSSRWHSLLRCHHFACRHVQGHGRWAKCWLQRSIVGNMNEN